MSHSQRMNDPCVTLYIILGENGSALLAHCVGCIAGQGECCTNIASVLFYIEAWNRVNETLSCTQVKCSWFIPRAVKEVPYAPVSDIDFRSAKKLKQNLDQTIKGLTCTTELNYCKSLGRSLSSIHLFPKTFVSKSRNILTISDLFDKKCSDLLK